ncbi:MAG: aldolase [Hyphomicrobiales bacterium]|nr:MAG: aldolase [Hyphomicrobiales bacterium]
MAKRPHLNGAISILADGLPVFATITPAEPTSAQDMASGPHDAVIFDMEHRPWDPAALRNSLQYLLSRRQIWSRDDLAPAVTPLVRIPANGGEMNQWLAKQVLDAGVYGVVWPHISTVNEARNAVASCRYPRPSNAERFQPGGVRGFGPANAARYWGVDIAEYCERADVWPYAPDGDVLVVIMCEEGLAVRNLPRILSEVPGIGAVVVGVADLSMDLGYGGQEHPEVLKAVQHVLDTCTEAGVACGVPGITPANVEKRLDQGFKLLLPNPQVSAQTVEVGKAWLAENSTM